MKPVKTRIVTQFSFPILTHVSHTYLDKEAQACNFIETVWRDKTAITSTIILLN